MLFARPGCNWCVMARTTEATAVVWVQSPADSNELALAPFASSLRWCHSFSEALRAAEDVPDLVVLELNGDTVRWLRCLESTRRPHLGTAFLFRTALTPLACRMLLSLPEMSQSFRISFRCFDSIVADAEAALKGQSVTAADGPLIQALSLRVHPAAAQIVCAAVRLGRNRAPVTDLARACSIPTRTLEWRCRRQGLPEARAALSAIFAINAFWRLRVLEWPIKRVAAVSGFRDRTGFVNAIRRERGLPPSKWREVETFEDAITRFLWKWDVLSRRESRITI
jgi:AraC-like DNA-binding protein